MSNTRGMNRREKLQYEARQRRLLGKSKLHISMEAFKPENMYATEEEDREDWENSGVMDNVRKTLNFGNDNDEW